MMYQTHNIEYLPNVAIKEKYGLAAVCSGYSDV